MMTVVHAFLVAIAFIFTPQCSARISTTTVMEPNGVSAVLLADDFGMAAGGLVKFDADIRPRRPFGSGGSRVYIVVVGEDTKQWYQTLIDDVNLQKDDPPPLCVVPSIGRFEVTESGSFNVSIALHDKYSAFLLMCSENTGFNGDVTSTFINLDPEGRLTQHLPIEMAMNPAVFTLMAVVYAGLVTTWIGEMIRLKPHVLPVHFLCLLCIVMRMIAAILVAAYYNRQSAEGKGQDALRVAAIVFTSLFQVVFLLTLLLFSLGWGFIRHSLRSKEGWLVTITMGFYAGISLLEAGCSSNQTAWCRGVVFVEYTVRCLIMLSTVVAINCNITNIRFCIQLPWTSSSALEYLKLSRYLSFRMTFLAYLLLPTALIVLKISILSWEYEWVYSAMEEFVTMLVLAHLGTTFAPLDPWLLTRAFDHSLEQS